MFSRKLFGAFFCFTLLLIIAGFAFNAFVFMDCMADGKRAYQCNAAMQNPHYIGIESWEDEQ